MNSEIEPHAPRESPLKNGNRQGDFRNCARCGAKTRIGNTCKGPAIRGRRRCRMHGGHSTGPKTEHGKMASQQSRLIHGFHTYEARSERKYTAAIIRKMKTSLDEIKDA